MIKLLWVLTPCVTTLLVLANCRGDGGKKANRRGTTSTTVETASGLDLSRSYFQSREVITFAFSANLASGGTSFSISNESTNATLIDEGKLPTSATTPEGYDTVSGGRAEGFLLNNQMIIRFYPNDRMAGNKFQFGENILKVAVTGADGSRKASQSTIYLRDFNLQGLDTVSFTDENIQRKDGYQGTVNVFETNSVSQDGKTLSSGTFQMINGP